MADEGAGLRRRALVMTCSPALVRCYALLRWLGVCSPGVSRADRLRSRRRSGTGLVVAETLVPDMAHHLAGNGAHLALHREAHVGSAGEGQLHQLGLIGGDLHAEVNVDPQLLDQVDQLVQGVGQGEFSDDGFPSFHHRLLGAERRR